jgi:hypothetical protein
MRESKSELTDRLRLEGRWEEFTKRREELKADGVPAKQAWFQAAAEFPSLATSTPDASPSVDLSALKGKPGISVLESATWVFEHLDTPWVTPADSPSAGAWSLLVWARSNMAARSEFYRNFAAKIVMPPQEKTREVEEASSAHERELRRRLFGHLEDTMPSTKTSDANDEFLRRLVGDSDNHSGGTEGSR